MEKASLETQSEKSPKLSRNTDDESEKEGLLEVCGWTQDERHVKVNIDVGAGVASEDVDVIIETNLCHVKLKDGRKWRCDLFAPIQEEGSTVQHEGSTVRLTLVKFEPNVHWQQLQEKLPVMEAEKEKESEATDKPPRTYAISLAKHNWYEKAGFMVVNVYVKRTRKDVVKIDFQESSFQVIFATADEKFLSMHEDTDKDTLFSWTVMLREPVNVAECKYKVTTTMVEVTLSKVESKHWPTLEAPSVKPAAAAAAAAAPPVPCNTWIPAQAKAVEKAATPTRGNSQDNRESDSNASKPKPTCMVSPINKPVVKATEPVLAPGFTGLDNLGNTCFMNSVLQALSNTREFRDHFLEGRFQTEINTENPLGTGGKLAVAFAVLVKVLWSGTHRSYPPSKLKHLVSLKANQFTGFAQHDAQEFMAFLLDGLHEDLNRVKKKPYVVNPEDQAERSDAEAAHDMWSIYRQRNNSFIVDLFQGQYKSKLVCPVCGKMSTTFDPFLYLSVPLPKKKRILPIFFFSKDPYVRPRRITLRLSVDATVEEMMEQVYTKTGVHPHCQRIFEMYKGKIHKFFSRGATLGSPVPTDILFVFEVLSEALAGEPIVEVFVIQRAIEHVSQGANRCSFCRREYESSSRLKRCAKCYRAAYCDQQCQRSHWSQHKQSCKEMPDIVGCPFVVSLPQSRATFSNLCQYMEAYSRYSVNVFQPPVKLLQNDQTAAAAAAAAAGGTQHPSSSSSSSLCSLVGKSEEASENSDSLPACASSASSLDVGGAGDAAAAATSPGVSSPGGEEGRDAGGSPPPPPADGRAGKTRAVTGQMLDVVERKERPFLVRAVTQLGITLPGTDGEPVEDKGDGVLELTGCRRLLSMDWNNREKLAGWVMVQSKELDYDNDGCDVDPADAKQITLEQCLSIFTEPEKLSPEEAWFCPRCKAHREATKQMSLWRLPTILIVQLKRFSFKNLIWRDKIDKMVVYPIRGLDLSPYCVGLQPGDPVPIYDLYAVVNHHGNILGGHYTTYSRLPDLLDSRKSSLDWRLFDDSHVVQMLERNACAKSAYLLFYHRRGSTTPPLPPAPPPGAGDISPAHSPPPSRHDDDDDDDAVAVTTDDVGKNSAVESHVAPSVESDSPLEDSEKDLSYTDMDTVD